MRLGRPRVTASAVTDILHRGLRGGGGGRPCEGEEAATAGVLPGCRAWCLGIRCLLCYAPEDNPVGSEGL